MDPVTTTTAATFGLAGIWHFIEHCISASPGAAVHHIIGGEAHHGFRHLLEKIGERLKDGELPANHDLAHAVEESLYEASRAFALGVAAQLEPVPPLLTAIQRHWKDGTLGDTPLADMLRDRKHEWVRELIAESAREHSAKSGIRAEFVLDGHGVTELLLRDGPQALAGRVHEAFADWLERRVQRGERPACVGESIEGGWPVGRGAHGRITFYQAFTFFFREKVKKHAVVFNILVAQTLAEMREELHGTRQDVRWIREAVAQMRPEGFAEFKSTVESLLPSFEQFVAWMDGLQDLLRAEFDLLNEKLDLHTELLVSIKEAVTAPPAAAPAPLHQLRPRPEGFVGRESDLAELRAHATKGGAHLTGLKGMGGIGKTALALVLAHEWAARFPDAQLFLDARGTEADPPSARALTEQVIRAFLPDPNLRLPDDDSAIAGIYRDVLGGKRVLILLDNARDAAQAQPLIPPAGCALIVTSRHTFMLGTVKPHDVGRLPDGEAAALLREFHPALGEDDAAALVKLCAGLPLALRLAGAHLAMDASERGHGGTPDVAGYLRALGSGRLAHLDADAADAGESVTISETLRLSEARLPEPERAAWRSLGVFTASFDARAAQAVVGADAAVLGHFLRRNLLEREGAERFKVHDLAADYACAQLGAEALTALHLAHARHYTVVAKEADRLYLKGDAVGGLALFDRERAQIEVAWAWLRNTAFQAVRPAGILPAEAEPVQAGSPLGRSGWKPEFHAARQLIALVNAVAKTGRALRFHLRQRIAWLESQLRAVRLVGDKGNEGAALSHLGNAHAALGDARKATGFHEQALVVMREIGDKRAVGTILGSLGNAHADLGDARKAIEYIEQHAAIAREIGDRLGEGVALGNLGLAHAALRDTRKAIEFYEQALIIMREFRDRSGEGAALVNLGNAHTDLGDARKAIEFHEQALVVMREIGDKRGQGTILGNLGNAHIVLGDARKAIEFCEQQLPFTREIGDRKGAGHCLWIAAVAHNMLRSPHEAIVLATAALEIFVAIESPHAAMVRAALAKWRAK